jgi:protein-tyrosine phosphatase
MGQYTQIIPGYTSPDRIHSTTNANIGPIGYSSHSSTSVGNIFKSFADERNYPLYVHCNHGADRTGTIMYLLNGLLGVPYEQLVQDFELTTFSASGTRTRTGINKDGTFDRTSEYAGISECSDQNYVAFDKLHELIMSNYGDGGKTLSQAIENYLISVCGLTSTEIGKIKSILLD